MNIERVVWRALQWRVGGVSRHLTQASLGAVGYVRQLSLVAKALLHDLGPFRAAGAQCERDELETLQ